MGLTGFARRAAEAGNTRRLDLVSRLPAGLLPTEIPRPPGRLVKQVSPDKDVDFRGTSGTYSHSLGPSGFVVLTRPWG